ncbi:MAG: hypothetical protein E3J23_08700 [Candidatus Stahlbacteria bacterium]|nr:MAG: hypothetical protein E3J23_08700 [Candidatus Stahlbacteria bacterium]
MAQITYPIRNDFSKGELSSRVEGRVDLPGYYQGCKIMENCIMVPQGGVEKRPGTAYIGTTYNPPGITASSAPVKLIPFEVNDSEIYILELGHNYLRIWDVLNKSLVQNGGGDLVINTEYNSGDVQTIQYAQTEGTIFFAHENYQIRKLKKTEDGFFFNIMGFKATQWISSVEYKRGTVIAYNGDYFISNIKNTGNTPTIGDWNESGTVLPDLSGDITAWVGGAYSIGDYAVHGEILWKANSNHSNKEPGDPDSIAGFVWVPRRIEKYEWKNFGDGSYTRDEWLNAVYGVGKWKIVWFSIYSQIIESGGYGKQSNYDIEYQEPTETFVYHWDDTGISLADIKSPQTLFEWDVLDTYNLNDYAYDPGDFRLWRSLKTVTGGSLAEGRYWDLITGNPLYNEDGDYPSSISFMGDRLFLGGTKNNPQSISASKIGEYNNFSMSTDDDDSFTFKIAADRSSRIKWMAAKDVLLIGTSSSEWLASGSASAAITPTNIQVYRQSAYGSEYQQSIFVADSLLFFQKGGRKLREYKYSNDNRAYLANDLTFFADHITQSGISQSSYQQNPDSILWSVKNNGDLIGLTYDRLSGIAGWHRHTTQGRFENVASVNGSGDEDVLWFIVRRNINGTDVRYIEEMSTRISTTQSLVVFSDSSSTHIEGDVFSIANITWSASKITITYIGDEDFANDDRVKFLETGIPGIDSKSLTVKNLNTGTKTFDLWDLPIGDYFILDEFDDPEGGSFMKSTDTITGLSHLEGEILLVLGDGAVFLNKTVSSGSITIESECNTIVVGLPYTMRLQPESIEIPRSSSIRSDKRISEVTLKVFNTLGGFVGPDENNLQEIRYRNTAVPFGFPPSLFTGNKKIQLDSSSTEEANILIVHNQPLPMTILAIISDISYSR